MKTIRDCYQNKKFELFDKRNKADTQEEINDINQKLSRLIKKMKPTLFEKLANEKN